MEYIIEQQNKHTPTEQEAQLLKTNKACKRSDEDRREQITGKRKREKSRQNPQGVWKFF